MIQAASHAQLQMIATGIRRTQMRLQHFEQQYGFSTEHLLKSEADGTIDDDSLDIIEWLGESRMLARLQSEYHELAEIEICS